MSETSEPRHERATVALVSEQVKGLRDLTEVGFRDMQRQLDAVAGLPVLVAKLSSDVVALDGRVEALEGNTERRTEWMRGQLPMLLVVGLGLAVNIVIAVAQLT